MSKQEEEYIHLISSSDVLNNSRKILLEIKRQENNPLIGPAFQFALVEYSKPFLLSHGEELNEKGGPKYKYSLGDEIVSDDFKELHGRIISDRKKLHAHDDLSVKEAKVVISETNSNKIVGIIQNNVYPTELISRIDEIIQMIEDILNNIYSRILERQEKL